MWLNNRTLHFRLFNRLTRGKPWYTYYFSDRINAQILNVKASEKNTCNSANIDEKELG
jgi:hypothetical protein